MACCSKSNGLLTMLILMAIFFVIKIVCGYLSNSVALIADSLHTLSDVISLAIAYVSVVICKKPTPRNTFGWARAEIVGALVNSAFLLALCFSIFVEAVQRFFLIEQVTNPMQVLIVSAAGLVINLLGMFLFHDHAHHHHHNSHHHQQHQHDEHYCNSNENLVHSSSSHHDLNMRAAFLHVLSDTIGSLIVMASALVIWLTRWSLRDYVDPAVSVVLVIIIVGTTLPVVRDSSRVLLQAVPAHFRVDAFRMHLRRDFPEILAIQQLHIWQLTGQHDVVVALKLQCKLPSSSSLANDETAMLVKRLETFLTKQGVWSSTIQLEQHLITSADDENVDSNVMHAIKTECCSTAQPPARTNSPTFSAEIHSDSAPASSSSSIIP